MPGNETTRVLRVITRLNVGGPARQALLLSRALAPEFETTLAAGVPAVGEGELSHPAVPVVAVPLVRPVHPPSDARALFALRRLLSARRPALVHTHMAKAGTIGRLATRRSAWRPRTVHTFHGHVLDGYFGNRVSRMFAETERSLARHTDVLVAVSAEIRDQLLDLGIGRPSQYRVIPLGLELDPFLAVERPSGVLRDRLGLAPDTPLVGVVGRLVQIKDHLTLLRALEDLPGVHLAVLGDGELRASLEAESAQMGMAGRVHFAGWWTDMAAAVSDLDVVALTSRNEGTPVALIEAAAAGVPVVATDVGGVRTVVEHGMTGLLAGPGDVETVRAHLTRLLADRSERVRMGRAGRDRVRYRFGQSRLLDDVRALYAELLPRGAPFTSSSTVTARERAEDGPSGP
ncbi:MAG: glycosyltransferase [Actinomycetota bacterium]|nr:glycosyltransferase [Actinomycetota bacterium]